jgi:hypothetical protein
MSVLKFTTRAALVALAMLAASAQPVSAKTVLLACDDDWRLRIDFDKGTLTELAHDPYLHPPE